MGRSGGCVENGKIILIIFTPFKFQNQTFSWRTLEPYFYLFALIAFKKWN